MKEELKQIVKIAPAFDKRSDIPSKNYGIGGARVFMILKGSKGAVHFVFCTGMMLEKTMIDYIKNGKAKYEMLSENHPFWLNKPMGYDVGFHALKPMDYQVESDGRDNCEWLDGKRCWGDGSAMRAEDYLNVLLEKGSDEIWTMLEKDYYEYFK